MATLFAAKLIHGLERLRSQGQLRFHGKIKNAAGPVVWARLIHALRQRKSVVFAKGSVVGPDALLEYLGRSTHRVAIANSRLTGIHADTVTFRYRNCRQGGKVQELSLAGVEFLRRLSLHIPPPGFTKVRYYGLLGNNRRKKCLPLAGRALETSSHRVDLSPVPPKPATWKPTPCERCGGLDLRCVGRTDSSGMFSGRIRGASPAGCLGVGWAGHPSGHCSQGDGRLSRVPGLPL